MHNNENKAGYKNSKVGWIPEEWNSFPLKTLTSRIGDGIHTTPDYVEKSDYYFINGNNLVDGRVRISEQTKCVSKEEFVKHHRELSSRTLLLSINGTIGSVAYFNEESVILGKSAAYINCCDRLDKTFAFCFLNSRKTSSFFRGELTGSTIQNLSLASIRLLPFALPPLPEQKAIAEVLECWDRGIRNLDLKIEKKRLVKNGLMQRLLSGKQRLKGFTKAWKSVSLGDLGKLSKGIGISKDELSETGIPCIRYGEIYTVHDFVLKEFHSYINPELAAQSSRIKKNDLLFAGSGETAEEIGKSVAYMDDSEAYAGGDIIILSVFSAIGRADYLSYYLNTIGREALNRMGQGQSVVHIYPKNLSKVCLTLPNLDEQQAIAGVLSAADSEIEALEKKLALWKEQKKHLLNNLVTGTIRLPQFCVKETTKKGKPCN